MPAAVHAIVARKMNHEIFDSAATFALEDHESPSKADTQNMVTRGRGPRSGLPRADGRQGSSRTVPGPRGALRDDGALQARGRTPDKIWQTPGEPGARPPVWCVEDEIGNGFMRGSPVSIGTAHITDRRTAVVARYWPRATWTWAARRSATRILTSNRITRTRRDSSSAPSHTRSHGRWRGGLPRRRRRKRALLPRFRRRPTQNHRQRLLSKSGPTSRARRAPRGGRRPTPAVVTGRARPAPTPFSPILAVGSTKFSNTSSCPGSPTRRR